MASSTMEKTSETLIASVQPSTSSSANCLYAPGMPLKGGWETPEGSGALVYWVA